MTAEWWQGASHAWDHVLSRELDVITARALRPVLGVRDAGSCASLVHEERPRDHQSGAEVSVPAEMGQLTSRVANLKYNLADERADADPQAGNRNANNLVGGADGVGPGQANSSKLTSVRHAIRELRAGGCSVHLDYGVTVDDSSRGDIRTRCLSVRS